MSASKPHFKCPICAKERGAIDAACPDCGWAPQDADSGPLHGAARLAGREENPLDSGAASLVRGRAACVACGGSRFKSGTLRGTAEGILNDLHFVPSDAGLLSKLLGRGTHVRARACEGCGNVQMFLDPSAWL